MGPEVRIARNLYPNPRQKIPWTAEQARKKKEQAEKFTREVLEDDDRADEIAAMSPEEYAAGRGKQINPNLGGTVKRKVSTQENTRTNPTEAALQMATKAIDKQNELQQRVRELENELDDRDKMLDAIGDIIGDEDPNYRAKERLDDIDSVFPEDEDEPGED
jgi:hypothetical protein